MDKYLFSYATAADPPIKRGLIRLVEKATGQPKLKRIYVQNQRFPHAGETFFEAAVRSLKLDVRYDAHALAGWRRAAGPASSWRRGAPRRRRSGRRSGTRLSQRPR